MEALDRQIVALLATDGRMSFTDLGRRTGLSTSAVHQRVRRLEERGVIRDYRARLAHEEVGLPLAAFIAITPLDPAAPDDIPERLSPVTEIDSCYSVAGEDNYVLLVRVASPLALEDLLARIRATAGVRTRSTVVLSTAWEDRATFAPPASLPSASPQ